MEVGKSRTRISKALGTLWGRTGLRGEVLQKEA